MLRVSVLIAASVCTGLLAISPASGRMLSARVPVVQSSLRSQWADWKKPHHRWVYKLKIHGPRFAYRHGIYRYYYGGWWYPRPWWAGPRAGPDVAVSVGPTVFDPGNRYQGEPYWGGPAVVPEYGQGDAGEGDDQPYIGRGESGVGNGYAGVPDSHVAWCMHRYQKYDPQTDTFWGYDGAPHRCISPY